MKIYIVGEEFQVSNDTPFNNLKKMYYERMNIEKLNGVLSYRVMDHNGDEYFLHPETLINHTFESEIVEKALVL